MKKITVLAIAYQAEKFVQRYLDNVLNYDYKNLELIIVNDGSSDKTEEIILQNRQKFIDRNITFKYLKMPQNKGAAAVINVGLQEVTGDYLSWQDVDDIFYPNCLSECLNYLLENPECKIVFSKAGVIEDDNINNIINYIPQNEYKHEDLFLDYILEKNVIFAPMRFVETKALFDVLQNKSIYESQGGQNWQLLLPMTYFYKWGYIDKILSLYVIHKNSHSHSRKYRSLMKHHENILLNTINRMPISKQEKIKYKKIIRLKYLKKKVNDLLRIDIAIKKKRYIISSCGHGIGYINNKWSFINE